MSDPLPCPSCGRPNGGRTPCPHCGVSFSPAVGPLRAEPVAADFTRVLILLGVMAGLLIGLAIGWRLGARALLDGETSSVGEPRVHDERVAERVAGHEPDIGPGDLLRDPREDRSPFDDADVRSPLDDDDVGLSPTPPPGMTADELRAQRDPDDRTGLVAVLPPQLDVSDPSDAPPLVTPRSVKRAGWFQGAVGYERALVERERSDAPLIVYFHTDWCAYCRRFDEDFLANEEIAGWLTRAQRVEVNPEQGDAELALARTFGIRGYPGFFVLPPGSDDPRRVHPFRRGQTISTRQFLTELKRAAGED